MIKRENEPIEKRESVIPTQKKVPKMPAVKQPKAEKKEK